MGILSYAEFPNKPPNFRCVSLYIFPQHGARWLFRSERPSSFTQLSGTQSSSIICLLCPWDFTPICSHQPEGTEHREMHMGAGGGRRCTHPVCNGTHQSLSSATGNDKFLWPQGAWEMLPSSVPQEGRVDFHGQSYLT